MSDTGYKPLSGRLRDYARVADGLLASLAAEKRKVAFTQEFDRLVFELAVSNARVLSDACRLLADRANRRDT